ncbi:MAG: right-handed parallel beta-helix repeat-containing protein [Chloroflexi bacterium]|nr:right-handed parallel beta-helix repeat-containing protein [Chloroflexota bacterium]
MTINDVDDVTVKGFKIRALQPTSHSYCGASVGIRAIHAKSVSITGNDIGPSGSGEYCGVSDGIVATAGTTGTVKGNTITGPAAGPGNPSKPSAGIKLVGVNASTSVRFDTIARFASDIRVQRANGGTIRNNTLTGGQFSLNIGDGDGLSIYDNTASGATVSGLYVSGPATGKTDANTASNNNVHDNDFRSDSNGGHFDCKGYSASVTSSNGNVFADNQGNSSNPIIMCDWADGPNWHHGAVPRSGSHVMP